jgi:hypothetical protein
VLDGYASTFAVGHLVVQVFGYGSDGDLVAIQKRGTAAAATAATDKIWPYAGTVEWPPRVALDEPGLHWLADAMLDIARLGRCDLTLVPDVRSTRT